MQGALRYRLSQFTRRVRTDLACLGGGLDTLDTLAAVLGDSIDRGAAGGHYHEGRAAIRHYANQPARPL